MNYSCTIEAPLFSPRLLFLKPSLGLLCNAKPHGKCKGVHGYMYWDKLEGEVVKLVSQNPADLAKLEGALARALTNRFHKITVEKVEVVKSTEEEVEVRVDFQMDSDRADLLFTAGEALKADFREEQGSSQSGLPKTFPHGKLLRG